MSQTVHESFTANLANFKWGRQLLASQQTSSNVTGTGSTSVGSSSNPTSSSFLSRMWSTSSGYMSLNNNFTQPRAEQEEEAYFALSRWDRLLVFGACLLGAAVCFIVAFFVIPLIPIRPQKFAIAFSLGSILFISAFAVLQGPIAFAKHLISGPRIAFTVSYFSSLSLTVYFSAVVHSYFLTLIFAIVQLVALIWFLVSYFPGGTQTLKFGTRMLFRQANVSLPF